MGNITVKNQINVVYIQVYSFVEPRSLSGNKADLKIQSDFNFAQ